MARRPSSKTKHFLHQFKIVAKYIVRYKKPLVTVMIFGLMSAAATALGPLLIGRFYDALTSLERMTLFGTTFFVFIPLVVAWLVARLVSDLAENTAGRQGQYLSEKIYKDFSVWAYDHVIKLPISFFKTTGLATIDRAVTQGANGITTITSNIIGSILPDFLAIFVAVMIAFFLQPAITAILLAGIIIYIGFMIVMVPKGAAFQRAMRDSSYEAAQYATDMVLNALPIKSSTAETFVHDENEKRHAQHELDSIRNAQFSWNLYLVQKIVVWGTYIAVFIYSITLILQGSLTVGQMITFIGFAAMLFTPFTRLAQMWKSLENSLINIERVDDILEHETEAYEPDNAYAPGHITGNVAFRDVSFVYDQGKKALDGVTIEIMAGEVVALVGKSGSGKTTLADMLQAQYFPSKGTILVDGHATDTWNLKSLRSKMAIVPQDIVLFNMSIYDNIRLANPKATKKEILKAADMAHVTEFVMDFPDKWKQAVGERGTKLSGGQKQRLAIARAIVRNPDILILDEPTSALDAESEHYITESLEMLMKGRTTFIIAHRLATVRRADKIIVLKKGKVVEIGSHDELVHKEGGEYARLHELQIQGKLVGFEDDVEEKA